MSVKMILFIGSYFSFCMLVAIGGRRTVIGFWGVLVLSILLTPLIPAFFISIFRSN